MCRPDRISDGAIGPAFAQQILSLGKDLAAVVPIARGVFILSRRSGELAAGSKWVLGKFRASGRAAASTGGRADSSVCDIPVPCGNEAGEVDGGVIDISSGVRARRSRIVDAHTRGYKYERRTVGGIEPHTACDIWDYGRLVALAGNTVTAGESHEEIPGMGMAGLLHYGWTDFDGLSRELNQNGSWMMVGGNVE